MVKVPDPLENQPPPYASVERSTREAAESSSLHGPELHPLAASVTIILSEPLLVAMMHSDTMLARFGTAGAMAAASTPREELLLHMSVDRC